jgi:hypothetical protein
MSLIDYAAQRMLFKLFQQCEYNLWRIEPMQTSEQIDKISPAFIKAQMALEAAEKNKANPGFKGTRYADIAAVSEAVGAAFHAQGIGWVQTHRPTDPGFIELSTRLVHESGQWFQGTLKMPLAKSDPQGFGSANTYARRYGLASHRRRDPGRRRRQFRHAQRCADRQRRPARPGQSAHDRRKSEERE